MGPHGHAAITLTLGTILYYYNHYSLGAFLSFVISGILIDIDHYIDYIRERGLTFNLKKVYATCKYGNIHFKKITVFLHSYELVILLWLVTFMLNGHIIWKYTALGFTLHLFIDQIVNPVLPFGYFLSFRIANNFETNKIFKRG